MVKTIAKGVDGQQISSIRLHLQGSCQYLQARVGVHYRDVLR